MASRASTLGKINLYEVLQDCNGVLKIQLIDAGMVRDFKQTYQYELDKDPNFILIRPTRPKNASFIRIPNQIHLTYPILIFFGMYDGDGNKTGDIGFAQNNTDLQTFTSQSIETLFPGTFPAKVNILEDSKAFEDPKIAARLVDIKTEMASSMGGIPDEKEVQKEFLRREIATKSMKVGDIQSVSITISPKKGGQKAGKRSYEIIVNRAGSRAFLPLLLHLIKSSIESVQNQGTRPGIAWYIDTQRGAFQALDLKAFINSDRCTYITPAGARRRYTIHNIGPNFLEISKVSTFDKVKIPIFLPITPLLCLMLGIYWAEGTTTKEKLLRFADENVENLSIGFNSSENASLKLFFEALSQLFVDPKQIVSNWLVKIGAKYHAESSATASKLGVPIARGGQKGEGIARSLEITQVAKTWAMVQFPFMATWESHFRHLEFTGAGIPRVDVRCRPAMAVYLFSIMRDLTFFEEELSQYLISINPGSTTHEH